MIFKRKVVDDLVESEEKAPRSSKPLDKKVVIVGAILGVVLILVLLLKLFGGGKFSYIGTMKAIFSNELGSFRYVISVNTGEAGTVLNTDNSVASAPVDEVESGEEAEAPTTETKYEFSDWDKYADVKSGDWEHPVYQVTIEGCTTSVEPLTSHFTVSIATPYASDTFTDVTCLDGKYYIDIETMRAWLVNSKDSYLTDLGDKLPQGSKYLVIPESEFALASRYAEDGEKDFSNITSLRTLNNRVVKLINLGLDMVQQSGGSSKATKDTATYTLSGVDAMNLVSKFKSYLVNAGDFQKQFVSDSSIYTDAQLQQALRETDNFIEACTDLRNFVETADLSNMNLQISGSCREFLNGQNQQQLEGDFNLGFVADGTDYSVGVTCQRSGDIREVTIPQGSQLTLADIEKVNSRTLIWDTCYSILDYFNITGVELEKQLEVTPSNITRNAKREFIKMVNDMGVYETHLTEHNLPEYLEKYMNYEGGADASGNDAANAKMVADFIGALNDITGGLVVEKEVAAQQEVERYPSLDFTENGVDFSLKYNEEESTATMIVLDGEAINKGETGFTLDLTMFSLHTLLSSIYPANNETLILAYDNNFDFDSMQTEADLPAGGWSNFKLYFIISDDGGHMDLFLGDTQMGAIVEY